MDQIGMMLLASTGIAGLILGIAAQRVLGNLFAGLVLAFAPPVRSGDAVLFEGEFGWVEEVTLTDVVIRSWDQRRIVVPITDFLDQPMGPAVPGPRAADRRSPGAGGRPLPAAPARRVGRWVRAARPSAPGQGRERPRLVSRSRVGAGRPELTAGVAGFKLMGGDARGGRPAGVARGEPRARAGRRRDERS